MQVSVAHLKAQLSSYLALIRQGQEVVVTDRGRPVARLVPYRAREDEQAQWLSRLAREGIVSLPKEPMSQEFVDRLLAGPRASSSRSVLQSLHEERQEGDR